jgi:chorismate mutase/prephenate dehydratase
MDLDDLRTRIDALDDRLLALLNERAALAAQVGEVKAKERRAFFVPSREKAVVARLEAANPGPFPTASLRPVFKEVMSACRSLEQGLRVAFLGPEGTFTHLALKHQFGLSALGLPVGTVAAVFKEVEQGRADFGVVPIENSTDGAVTHTLDTFLESPLKISAEIILEVDQCLLGRPGLDLAAVERVYSHPQGLGQCRKWLEGNLSRAALVEAPSTAEAARLAREDAGGAAIASELAADLFDLTVLRARIQDLSENATRFLVLGRAQADPTGRDRTSLLVAAKDGPGLLFHLLQPFAEAGLNLTKIESRPSRRKAWENVFFLDVAGHATDPAVTAALAALAPLVETVKVLGSYPMAEAVRP